MTEEQKSFEELNKKTPKKQPKKKEKKDEGIFEFSEKTKEEFEKIKSSDFFKSRCYGVIGVLSENSLLNADFNSTPKRLPDEDRTFYTTDKVKKYAIRDYFNEKGLPNFNWKTDLFGSFYKKFDKKEALLQQFRSEIDDLDILCTIKEEKNTDLIKDISDPFLKERLSSFKDDKNFEKKLVRIINLYVFALCQDIKFFGVTYAEKDDNIGLTGNVQIQYAKDSLKKGEIFSNEILTQFPFEKEDKKTNEEGDENKEAKNTTLGNETKLSQACFFYNFSINPKNITKHNNNDLFYQNLFALKKREIELLKDAFKYSVSNLNTASRIGSNNMFLLFITLKEDSELILPTLATNIKINESGYNYELDFSDILKKLETKKDHIEKIEIFVNQFLPVSIKDEDVLKKQDKVCIEFY